MTSWKRLTALLLAALMTLGLTACSVDREDIAAAAQAVAEIATAIENAESAVKDEDPARSEDASPPAATEAPREAPEETPLPPEDAQPEEPDAVESAEEDAIDRDGWYTTKEDVALYLHVYGELPGNFITKSEARELGWSGGGLDGYADGKSIGGDYFGNYEGLLPDGNYHECDVNTMHASSRGAERLVYSDDGRIYYTNDHYESYTLLYGEE